jgi:hypothetical protein
MALIDAICQDTSCDCLFSVRTGEWFQLTPLWIQWDSDPGLR